MGETFLDFRCPACGEAVSPNARSCSCGATRDGEDWLAPEALDGLDLGDDDFDYDDFIRREFGRDGRPANGFLRMSPKERFWWVVAVVLLVAFASLALSGWW